MNVPDKLAGTRFWAIMAEIQADIALVTFIGRIAPRIYFRDELDDIRDLFESVIYHAAEGPIDPIAIEGLSTRQAQYAAEIFSKLPVGRGENKSEVISALVETLTPAIARALKTILPSPQTVRQPVGGKVSRVSLSDWMAAARSLVDSATC